MLALLLPSRIQLFGANFQDGSFAWAMGPSSQRKMSQSPIAGIVPFGIWELLGLTPHHKAFVWVIRSRGLS